MSDTTVFSVLYISLPCTELGCKKIAAEKEKIKASSPQKVKNHRKKSRPKLKFGFTENCVVLNDVSCYDSVGFVQNQP